MRWLAGHVLRGAAWRWVNSGRITSHLFSGPRYDERARHERTSVVDAASQHQDCGVDGGNPRPAMGRFACARFHRVGRAMGGGPRPSLADLLLVLAVTGIVGGSMWAVIADSRYETRCGTARFRLSMIRSQISMYRTDHGGLAPANLEQLTITSDQQGRVGVGHGYWLGPYLEKIPENPFNSSATVLPPAHIPPRWPDATAGWLYDPATGEVWLNHADLLCE